MKQSSHSLELSESGFRAQLREASLPDLVQMECLSRSQRTIRVTTIGNIGYLYFDEGQIIHAATLEVEGEDAAREILLWSRGTFEPCERPWPARPSIAKSWQLLLLEAAHARDEKGHHDEVELPLIDVTELEESPISEEHHFMKNSLADAAMKSDEPGLWVRLNAQGAILSSHGATEEYAEMMAYTCRLVEVIGELLGMDGFQALEYASGDARCFIYRESNGEIVAQKTTDAAVVAQLREKLGL